MTHAKTVETPITSWLILGSIPNGDMSRVLAFPYLPEADLAPSPDEEIAGRTWRSVSAPEAKVDLLAQGFADQTFCAAYAFTYLHAGAEADAQLLLGSDDGIAAWLNGIEVWRNDCGRAHTARQDVAPVSLQKGWNRLLLKISQHVGGWAFSCHVTSSATLKVGLKNPTPKKWPGPSSEAMGPAVLGIKPLSCPPAGATRLAIEIFSRTSRLEGAEITLAAGDAEPLARAALPPTPAFAIGTTELAVETVRLLSAVAADRFVVGVKVGKGSVSLPPPADLPRVLLLAAARASKSSDVRQTAGQLDAQLAIHGLRAAAPFAIEARKALDTLAKGDVASAKVALESLQDVALEGVPDRKGDTVHVVGHAHIDMNWLWTYPETVKTAHDTFRQAIAFMEEFPDFTFLQSQPSTYKAIEALDPPLFARIRERVKEGRWEIAGGMYTEGDTNLSGGEALVRSFLLAQRYFLHRFGKTACVGWLPDNFGHISQLPQLLRLAGCEFYYFHRCRPHYGTFWWEGPDGSRVLCYSNDTYNGQVRPAVLAEIDKVVPEQKRLLSVCGVGDHGGGPTRLDIESTHALDTAPRFPAVRFTTAEAFFRASLREAVTRPVHLGEMQYIFEGCYTSIARVKEGNRRCEATLQEAERLSVLCRLIAGEPYPGDALRKAWEVLVFNQFHDILCGSATHESNADSVADYKWANSRAEGVRDRAFRHLADGIRMRSGLGQPVVVFNPHPGRRTAVVEADVFSHDRPSTAKLAAWSDYYGAHRVEPQDRGQGPVPTVLLRDPTGVAIPAQIVSGKVFPPGFRSRVQFVATNLPPGGYRTYYVDVLKPGEFNQPFAVEKREIETEFFKVKFDWNTGDIVQLFDKRMGKEFAANGGRLNRLRVYAEAPHGMSAWYLGPITKEEDVTEVASVRLTERGPVRACIEAEKKWGRSRFIQRTYLYRSYPRIDFEIEAHWFEQGDAKTDAPMLRVVFALAMTDGRFDCHVPFDVVERPATGREVPAQQWVDVSDGKKGIALLNRSKYGHSFDGQELRLTLLRSSYDPDIYPDQGLHRIAYSLFPHAGDWRNGVWHEGDLFNLPPIAAEPPSLALGQAHATRPEEAALVEITPATGIALTGLKQAEDSEAVIVRIAETDGKQTVVAIRLPLPARSARRYDLLERQLSGAPNPLVESGVVRLTLRPHEIATVAIAV